MLKTSGRLVISRPAKGRAAGTGETRMRVITLPRWLSWLLLLAAGFGTLVFVTVFIPLVFGISLFVLSVLGLWIFFTQRKAGPPGH